MIPIKNEKSIKHVITAVQGTWGGGRAVLGAPEQNSSWTVGWHLLALLISSCTDGWNRQLFEGSPHTKKLAGNCWRLN